MDATQIISLFGALGIGSVIGQYLGSTNERRTVRAGALKALAGTESARWVHDETSRASLSERARDLEAAALVARLPRAAVLQYLMLAYTAYELSDEGYQRDPHPEYGGGIPGEFADVVHKSAALLTDLVWGSHLRRVRLGSLLREINDLAQAIEDDDVQRHLVRFRERFVKSL